MRFESLEWEIAELLFRPPGRPSHKPLVRYKSFRYQAGSWTQPRRIVAKVEHHAGELFPRVGFIVTNLRLPMIRYGRLFLYLHRGKTTMKWSHTASVLTIWILTASLVSGQTLGLGSDVMPGGETTQAGLPSGSVTISRPLLPVLWSTMTDGNTGETRYWFTVAPSREASIASWLDAPSTQRLRRFIAEPLASSNAWATVTEQGGWYTGSSTRGVVGAFATRLECESFRTNMAAQGVYDYGPCYGSDLVAGGQQTRGTMPILLAVVILTVVIAGALTFGFGYLR